MRTSVGRFSLLLVLVHGQLGEVITLCERLAGQDANVARSSLCLEIYSVANSVF
ncbi:hypothetical protein Pint_33735 [Pistacia integerrima]|uniref:Uncharacterized protein n=1 Tax=Pistacia integerrima TaxID=434235 RepID=A0ACC0X6I8_9ROSI|nr:hypothetical protein Pint_33735 [Pistacia integerrima]